MISGFLTWVQRINLNHGRRANHDLRIHMCFKDRKFDNVIVSTTRGHLQGQKVIFQGQIAEFW